MSACGTNVPRGSLLLDRSRRESARNRVLGERREKREPPWEKLRPCPPAYQSSRDISIEHSRRIHVILGSAYARALFESRGSNVGESGRFCKSAGAF